MTKIFFLLVLSVLSTPILAKEKLTGMLGAKLGDNVIQAIGKKNNFYKFS